MTNDEQSFWYKQCQFLNQCNYCTKNKNEYESIQESCFKRNLSMDVKNDGADFGYFNVSSHVLCF